MRCFERLLAYSLSVVFAWGAVSGCSSAAAKNELKDAHVDKIVISKSGQLMTLMSSGRALRSYKVALGRTSGAKRQEGDHKTPEGGYIVDGKNAASRFHLALHVSYPNASDLRVAQQAGVKPGGAIMIHGVERGFGWIGPLQHEVDWTDGCIAVTNREIEEIWRAVPIGTPVEIKP